MNRVHKRWFFMHFSERENPSVDIYSLAWFKMRGSNGWCSVSLWGCMEYVFAPTLFSTALERYCTTHEQLFAILEFIFHETPLFLIRLADKTSIRAPCFPGCTEPLTLYAWFCTPSPPPQLTHTQTKRRSIINQIGKGIHYQFSISCSHAECKHSPRQNIRLAGCSPSSSDRPTIPDGGGHR